MAISNDNKKVYIGSGLTIGEIKTVLNFNSNDLGTLCGGKYPTASSYPNTNVWAKYKPFRDSSLFFADASAWQTAMRASGCGFGNLADTSVTPTPYQGQDGPEKGVRFFFNSSSPFWTPEWASKYKRPRGVNQNYNEPYRQLDFADLTASSTYGYYKDALPPIQVVFPSTINQAGGEIIIKANSGVNGWSANTDLSTSDLFASLDSGKNYYIGVLFRSSSWSNLSDANLLVIDSLASVLNSNSQISIPFTGDPTVTSKCYVPLFGSTGEHTANDGDTIYSTVCLVEYSQSPSDQPDGYQILTGSGITSHAIISLNLENDIDKATKTYIKMGNLYGTSVEVNDFTLSSAATLSGGYKAFYMQNIKLKINDVGPYAYSGEQVYCKLFIKVNRNNWVMATDQYDGQTTNYDPSSGTYYPSSNPGIKNGDGNYEVTFTIPSTIPSSAWDVLVGYGSGSGHMLFPYIYAPGAAGDTFSVEISGYIYNGNDVAASRVNITSKTKTITF